MISGEAFAGKQIAELSSFSSVREELFKVKTARQCTAPWDSRMSFPPSEASRALPLFACRFGKANRVSLTF